MSYMVVTVMIRCTVDREQIGYMEAMEMTLLPEEMETTICMGRTAMTP